MGGADVQRMWEPSVEASDHWTDGRSLLRDGGTTGDMKCRKEMPTGEWWAGEGWGLN